MDFEAKMKAVVTTCVEKSAMTVTKDCHCGFCGVSRSDLTDLDQLVHEAEKFLEALKKMQAMTYDKESLVVAMAQVADSYVESGDCASYVEAVMLEFG